MLRLAYGGPEWSSAEVTKQGGSASGPLGERSLVLDKQVRSSDWVAFGAHAFTRVLPLGPCMWAYMLSSP